MFSNKEFVFTTQQPRNFRRSGDTYWIALNQQKMRMQHGGSGFLVTDECTSLKQLENEVARLKADLESALDDARKELGSPLIA